MWLIIYCSSAICFNRYKRSIKAISARGPRCAWCKICFSTLVSLPSWLLGDLSIYFQLLNWRTLSFVHVAALCNPVFFKVYANDIMSLHIWIWWTWIMRLLMEVHPSCETANTLLLNPLQLAIMISLGSHRLRELLILDNLVFTDTNLQLKTFVGGASPRIWTSESLLLESATWALLESSVIGWDVIG